MTMLLYHRNSPEIGIPSPVILGPVLSVEASLLRFLIKQRCHKDDLVFLSMGVDERLPSTAGIEQRPLVDYHPGRAATDNAFGDSMEAARTWVSAIEQMEGLPPSFAASAPRVLEWELHYPIMTALEFLAQIRRAFEEEAPSSVSAIGLGPYNAIIEAVALTRGVRCYRRDRPLAKGLTQLRAKLRRPTHVLDLVPASPHRGTQASRPCRSPEVLMVASGTSGAKNALPVAQELVRGNGVGVAVLPLTEDAARASQRNGALLTYLHDWVDRSEVPAPADVGAETDVSWWRVDGAISSGFSDEEIDLLGPWLSEVLRDRLRTRMPEAIVAVETMGVLLERCNPRIVVCDSDVVWLNRALIEVAREQVVHTMILQDGRFENLDLRGVNADAFCVDGRANYREIKRGDPTVTVRVTGQPRFDQVVQDLRSDRGEGSYGRATAETEVLCFAATGKDTAGASITKERVERAIIEALPESEGIHLRMKLHPQDPGTLTERIVSEAGRSGVDIIRDQAPEQLIRASDVVVCATTSTTAYETVLQRKPLLLLNFDESNPMPELVETGVAQYVASADALWNEVQRIGRRGSRPSIEATQRFLREYFISHDGGSTDRVVQAILEDLSIHQAPSA